MPPTEARLTIGGTRASRVAMEREWWRANPLHDSLQPPNNELKTSVYIPPAFPDRLSRQPVGRHRPEYIRSEGRTPVFMHTIMTEPTTPAPELIPPLPKTPAVQEAPVPLPRRVPMASVDPLDLATLGIDSPPQSVPRPLPTGPDPQAVLDQLSGRHTNVRAPFLLSQLQRGDPDSLHEDFGMLGTGKIKTEAPRPAKPATQAPLRSATESGIHARRGSAVKRRVIAATAVVVTGLGLLGGFQFMRNATENTTSLKGSESTIPLPKQDKSVETETPPQSTIQLTQVGAISDQDGGGYGHAINLARNALERNYALNGTTNIIAKVGAYDSLAFSPDPDAAKSGDTFIGLTKSAIQLVDRLRQPLAPDASQAEIAAAQIIYRLNTLSPMSTQQVIELYGSEIQALKTHMTTILTAQQEHQTASSIDTARVSVPGGRISFAKQSSGGEAGAVIAAATMVGVAGRQRHFTPRMTPQREEALARGREAIAELARERDLRRAQPSIT